MKKVLLIHLCLFLLVSPSLISQPYHIDKSKPEPTRLLLFDDPENEGVKLSFHEGELEEESQRFFIKGYSEYQPVDIFLFSVEEGVDLELEVVLATWNDKKQTCQTGSDGYCQLKFRNYGSIGLDVKGDPGSKFAIVGVVGKEVLPKFDSPFYQVSQNDLDKLSDTNSQTVQEEASPESASNPEGGMNKMILYVIAFFLLLIVIFLGMMVFRKNKGANMLILLLLSIPTVNGQVSVGSVNERLESLQREFDRFKSTYEKMGKGDEAFKKIEELRKLQSTYGSFNSAYEGLGDCIATTPPWTSPRIPSFCESVDGEEEGACASCFLSARREFNDVRFTLSRLETIYKCTKNMTTAAKAFGDTWSSATKSGIGWVSARKDIEESEKRLAAAYDKKYAELMKRLHDSLVEMSVCEAKYGLEDWYDRFGFIYYEFMADRYKRSN